MYADIIFLKASPRFLCDRLSKVQRVLHEYYEKPSLRTYGILEMRSSIQQPSYI